MAAVVRSGTLRGLGEEVTRREELNKWLGMNGIALSVALIWGMHGEGGVSINECVTGCTGGAPVGKAIVFPGDDHPIGVVESILGGDNEGLEGEGGLGAGKKARAAAEPDDRGIVASNPTSFGTSG